MDERRSDDKLLEQARARFRFAADSESKQRELELADQKFAAGNSDNNWQWPQEILDARRSMGDASKAQPCLTVNKIKPSLNQIFNQARQAKLAVEVHPKSGEANQDVADVLQGLIRNIEVQSHAQVARQWAFERAVTCGRGYYRLATEYSNDGDDDQDIVVKRILNQASVYLDPTAQEPDGSDAEWALIAVNLTEDQYKAEYGDSELAGKSLEELQSVGEQYPGWADSGENGKQTIRVAEYFYVTTSEEKTESRTIKRRKVNWCIINAVEVLKRFEWAGRYIPIIPVLGVEQNIDGERIYEGVTRPAKDVQRSRNYLWSKNVQASGLAPIAPWIMEEGQIEGHEAEWNSANRVPYSTLVYRRSALGGTPAPPPERNVVEPAIEANSVLMQQADHALSDVTGVPPVSLGNLDPHDRSGKAVQALQRQADVGSSNYLDNLARAITYEGKQYVDLIPKVYDTPGRILRILGIDDEPKSVMVNKPFIRSQKGQPMEAPPAAMDKAEHFDLTKGQYAVTVEVGKQQLNDKDSANEGLTALIGAAPQLAPLIAPEWVETMSFTGAHKVAQILKDNMPPRKDSQEQQGPDPQQMQAQIQQMDQMLQLLAKELEAKTRIIDTDAVKFEQQMALKEKDKEIQQMKIDADLAMETMKLNASAAEAVYQQEIARIQQMVDQSHEQIQGEQGRQHEQATLNAQQQHEAGMQGADQAHEADLTAQGQQHEAAMTGAQQAHEMTMAEQQAAQSEAGA